MSRTSIGRKKYICSPVLYLLKKKKKTTTNKNPVEVNLYSSTPYWSSRVKGTFKAKKKKKFKFCERKKSRYRFCHTDKYKQVDEVYLINNVYQVWLEKDHFILTKS